MALLRTLGVSGIRSFGSDGDTQYLEFKGPLTLILGRNGCGKTTIIESLKYACTGTMPHGQGVNFVRDPKLDGRSETRGQVKLSFDSCQGKKITITRSMSAVQKIKNSIFKTLDVSVSVTEPNGEKTQISGRCVDLDELMCQFLGVTKPILNYVIFCHQEDSHWPLEEGKKVKEKFDEIFDSTKYNKCMTALREYRTKNVLPDIKTAKESIKHLEANVRHVKEKRGELALIEKRYEDTQTKMLNIKEEIKKLGEEYNVWSAKETNFREIEKERDDAASNLKHLSKMVEELRGLCTLQFTGTEDELNDDINKYREQFGKTVEAHKQIQKVIDKLNQSETSLQRGMSVVQTDIGKLGEAKKQESSVKDDRNSKLSNLGKVFGFSPLPGNATDADVNELNQKIEKELSRIDATISTLKRKHDEKEKELQFQLRTCVERKSKLKAEINMKMDSILTNDSDLKSLKDKLHEVNLNVSKKQRVDAELNKCRQEYERATQAEDSEALKSEIKNLQTDCKILEERQQNLLHEVRRLSTYQEKQKELQKCEERSSEVQSLIRRLRTSNHEFIKDYLKDSSDNSIRPDLENLIRKLRKDIEQIKQQLADKNGEVVSLEKDRKLKKDMLKLKQEELAKNEEAIFESCGRKKVLDDVLRDVEAEIETAQSDKGMVSSMTVVSTQYIKKLQMPDPCCPLCHRDFPNAHELNEIIDDLKGKASKLPAQIEEMNEKLTKLQAKHRKLLLLKPVQERTDNLKSKEIPKLQEELKQIEDKYDEACEEVVLIKGDSKNPEDALKHAEMIHNDVIEIDRSSKEAKQLNRRIDELKRDLPSTDNSRTFDQALAEQQFVQDELASKRSEKEDAEKRQLTYMTRINELDRKINELVSQQLKIQDSVKQEEKLQERFTELSTLKTVLEKETKELEEKLAPAEDDEKKADEALQLAKTHHRKDLEEKQRDKEGKVRQMNSIKELQDRFNDFQRRNLTQALQEKQEELVNFKKQLSNLQTEREKFYEESSTLSNDIKGHEQREKALQTSLSLMKKEKEVQDAKDKLTIVEAKLGRLDFRGVRAKCDELMTQLGDLTKKKNEFVGNLQGLEENIQSRRDDLTLNKQFRDAEKLYKEKFVQLTVLSHVEKDLQKYYTALDFALQKFHEDRMKSINKIIRELWRLIYKGNDIDFIEIKTDQSLPTATAATVGTDKRRTYNYRVVQVKKGTEIEMRGRCSAGQKVLASLIIRMALAETFSANCGILTLDEPTTNLDKANISSLSSALTEIVSEHQSRKNFQLIVITHDEEFLRSMSDAHFFTHYYEVSRNRESKSQIKRMPVVR